MAGPLTVDQRKYLQVIERNGQALLHLINDVLDLSRIEAGHLEMDVQDIDLGAARSSRCVGALVAAGRGQEPRPDRRCCPPTCRPRAATPIASARS